MPADDAGEGLPITVERALDGIPIGGVRQIGNVARVGDERRAWHGDELGPLGDDEARSSP